MDRSGRKSKPRRVYDASRRAARAGESRGAVVDAAERLFLADGYAGTTIASIAAAAGVSVETVYKAFGGKAGLVRAIRDRRLGGSQPVHAEERSNRARRAADPRALVASWGRLASEVAPLVSPILLLVRDAAATDGEMATLRDELDADRLRRMKSNARHLHSGGHLRDGMTLSQAAEVMWTFSSPELYELLVFRRGWSPARYGRFIADSLTAALLRPEASAG